MNLGPPIYKAGVCPLKNNVWYYCGVYSTIFLLVISLYLDMLIELLWFQRLSSSRFCELAVHNLGVQSIKLLIQRNLPQATSLFGQVTSVFYFAVIALTCSILCICYPS